MSKTYIPFHRLLSGLTTGFLVAGIVMVLASTGEMVQATIIGPGTTIAVGAASSVQTEKAPMQTAGVFQTSAETRLMIGMLLVLAGFGIHALTIVRARRGMQSRTRSRSKTLLTLRRTLHRKLV